MIIAPIPDTDSQRLAALRALELLDTPQEERFDNLTRLAAQFFSAPISYISFVDENRQWLKSRIGLDFCESDRSSSFCGHAILEKTALVIPDTLKDRRFHDNPMVTGKPFARFYAGQPLKAPGGHTIGTLCIVDTVPRHFDERSRETLRQLGHLVERELLLFDAMQLQFELLEAKDRLLEKERRLEREMSEAAEYVRKLLPSPVDGDVAIDWVFHPSLDLGGDAFGYHWVDDKSLALYLMDVCGHGVGPALLSVSVMNMIKTRELALDFHRPAKALESLNRCFPMATHHDLFFTMWLGIYEPESHRLTFGAGGHPPAILRRADGSTELLERNDPPVGMVDGAEYSDESVTIRSRDTLYIFSDGAFEIPLGSSGMMQFEAFENLVREPGEPISPAELHDVLRKIASDAGNTQLLDDLSIVRIQFG